MRQRGVGVAVLKGVLLEKVLADGACGFQKQAVLSGEGVHTYQLDDLVEIVLQLQGLEAAGGVRHPARGDLLVEPRREAIAVE